MKYLYRINLTLLGFLPLGLRHICVRCLDLVFHKLFIFLYDISWLGNSLMLSRYAF